MTERTRALADRTVTDPPATRLIAAAWTVCTADGDMFKLWLPDRTRCWSYFTKPAARRYAREIGGYIDGPSTTRSYKEAVL